MCYHLQPSMMNCFSALSELGDTGTVFSAPDLQGGGGRRLRSGHRDIPVKKQKGDRNFCGLPFPFGKTVL